MATITNTFVKKLKKQAKLDCKSSPLSLTQIQDEMARSYGYLNWRTFITFAGRGAVTVENAEIWFRQKYTDSSNRSRIYPAVEEPSYIFDIIAEQYDFALEYDQGGRMAQLAESLAEECSWICEDEIDNDAGRAYI